MWRRKEGKGDIRADPEAATEPVAAADEAAPDEAPDDPAAAVATASEVIPFEGEVWVTQLDEAGVEYAAEGVTVTPMVNGLSPVTVKRWWKVEVEVASIG